MPGAAESCAPHAGHTESVMDTGLWHLGQVWFASAVGGLKHMVEILSGCDPGRRMYASRSARRAFKFASLGETDMAGKQWAQTVMARTRKPAAAHLQLYRAGGRRTSPEQPETASCS